MTKMRAKVKVNGVTPFKNEAGEVQSERLDFVFPAKDSAYPPDGSDEDQQFARYSPSASLSLTVANPALLGKFAVGDKFYLDFVPVE